MYIRYFILFVIVVVMVLGAIGIYCGVLRKRNKQLEKKLGELYQSYNEIVYNNCVYIGKLEKIKGLNVLDMGNEYHKELLNTNID